MGEYGRMGLGRIAGRSGIDRVIAEPFTIYYLAREIREILGESPVHGSAPRGEVLSPCLRSEMA